MKKVTGKRRGDQEKEEGGLEERNRKEEEGLEEGTGRRRAAKQGGERIIRKEN